MPKFGAFINLPQNHSETGKRQTDIENQLPTHTPAYAYGEGKNGTYQQKANDLVRNNPDAAVFIATCWPTLDALLKAPNPNNIPIVFAGLITNPGRVFSPNVTGVQSFDLDYLCPFWPALLKAIAPPNLTQVAVIYDEIANHTGMAYQYTVISNNITGFGFQLSPIRADGPNDLQPTNPNLAGNIATFLQGVGNNPAGLIVTAGTRTTMLRDDIITAVRNRNNNSANKLFAIYPFDFYMDTPGALMAYGPNIRNLYPDVVNTYVKPVIAGQRPPISTNSPSNFELTVSQSAAIEVNFTIPPQFIIKLANNQTVMLRRKLAP